MSEIKKYCQTHHLYYKGEKCPLCEKERIQLMTEKYSPKKKVEKPKEASKESLKKLIEKFNVK